MRKLKRHYQILEIEQPSGHRKVIAGGKTKRIALDALRMMSRYKYHNVEWGTPFIQHNMTDTEVVQGIVRLS